MANPCIMDYTGGRPASQGGRGATPRTPHARPGEPTHQAELESLTREINQAEAELGRKRAHLQALHAAQSSGGSRGGPGVPIRAARPI